MRSRGCAGATPTRHRTFHRPRERPPPWAVAPCSPTPLTAPRRPQICFLSQWGCLFWTFRRHAIAQHVGRCLASLSGTAFSGAPTLQRGGAEPHSLCWPHRVLAWPDRTVFIPHPLIGVPGVRSLVTMNSAAANMHVPGFVHTDVFGSLGQVYPGLDSLGLTIAPQSSPALVNNRDDKTIFSSPSRRLSTWNNTGGDKHLPNFHQFQVLCPSQPLLLSPPVILTLTVTCRVFLGHALGACTTPLPSLA